MSENKNKIEDLKRKLYDPNYDKSSSYRIGILRELKHDVKEDWEKLETKEMTTKTKKIKYPSLRNSLLFQ